MEGFRFYFSFGVSQILLGCCVLTSATSNTTTMFRGSLTPTTILPSIQSCSTRSCGNVTVSVNATGNTSSTVVVQSSCSVVSVSCVADAPFTTTSSLAGNDLFTSATGLLSTSTHSTTSTNVAATQFPLSTAAAATLTAAATTATAAAATTAGLNATAAAATTAGLNATAAAATTAGLNATAAAATTAGLNATAAAATTAGLNATAAVSGSSQTTSLAPSHSISSVLHSASSSQTSNSTASDNQPPPPPSPSPLLSSFTSTPSVSQNQRSTVSPSTTNTTVVPSTPAVVQPPTLQPKSKFISIKVTFDMPFKEEYRNRNSEAYKDLEKNLTVVLSEPFKKIDGFLRVEILSFREGSVVCDFDVIFNETASPKVEDVKKTLQEASKNGLGGYAVKDIKVEGEKKDEEEKDDLPLWAFVTLILLGALGVVLLITVVILVVLLKRTKESGPAYRVTGEEWANYESMSMGDYKVRAEEVGRGRIRNANRNNQPVYENHPTSHSNLTYQVPANGE